MSLELLLATAFVIGLVHSVEPDHVVAVTAFVTRRPEPRGALGFAVRWGLGHALAVLLIGTALVFVGLEVPTALETSLHGIVGVVLVALGGWVLWHALGRGTYETTGSGPGSLGAPVCALAGLR